MTLTLVTVLRERSEQADVLIVNGGLGPTSDDLSALAAATAKGEGLILHEEWLETMTRFFAERGRPMAASNRKQAEIPASAEMINNPVGTACGFAVQLNRCLMFFTPGVPSEFKIMVEQEILPRLRERFRSCPAAVSASDDLWPFGKRSGAKPRSAGAAAGRGHGLPLFNADY
jgi:competence/damage-inducible protein CinA-like protein